MRVFAILAFVLLETIVPARTEVQPRAPLVVKIENGPLSSQPAARDMLANARRAGRLSVVVQLDFPMLDNLAASAEHAQARRLDAAQDALIARVALGRPDQIWKFAIIPAFAAEVTPSELMRLLADPGVVGLTENYALQLQLRESTQVIRARNLWLEGLTGAGQTIAVLDSGIDPTHPMMAGKIVSEACFSATFVIPHTYESLCPNGLSSQFGAGSGVNCPNNIFPCFHGTHIAGIAAGKSNLFRGVAPDANLISIQVTSRANSATEGCTGGFNPCAIPLSVNVLAGLDRVYALRRQFKIAAVNLSLSLGLNFSTCDNVDPPMRAAVEKLRAAGIAVIAAAGNQGAVNQLALPACLTEAVAVGATTDDDQALGTSNYDAGLKMMAPGQNITSAVPLGAKLPAGTTCLPSGRYCTITGTSQAAPHVAGALALLRQAKPAAKVAQMLSALVCTGKQVFRGGMSRPRINVLGAERELKAADAAERFDFNGAAELNAWTQVLGKWIVAAGQMTVTAWSASGANGFEWVAASHRYCSSSYKVDVSFDDMNVTSVPNAANGILLASNISVDGPTISATGLLFAHNQIGQVYVQRWTNLPMRGGVSIGGGSPLPCFTVGGPSLIQAHMLRVIQRGDGVYDFFINLKFMCTVTERQFPPPNQIVIMAARRTDEPNHELSIRWVDIKPR